MGHLSTDTLPLTLVPGVDGPEFVVRIDEHDGTVTLVPRTP